MARRPRSKIEQKWAPIVAAIREHLKALRPALGHVDAMLEKLRECGEVGFAARMQPTFEAVKKTGDKLAEAILGTARNE